MVTNEDVENIIKNSYDIACDVLNDNINEISSYDFSENFKNNVTQIMSKNLATIYPDTNLDDVIDYCVLNTLSIIYNTFIPKRSHYGTYTSGMPNVSHIAEKIEILRNVYQPDQRTDEWYRFRYNLITASNAWKIFDTPAALNQLIFEKCKPLDTSKYQTVNINSAMHWGQKYEPLSVMYYESKYKTIVEDFGCIPHPRIKCLGASPDGINVDETSERYGRMLEIKNPVSRKLTGIPKKDYWIQMQLQMATCNLPSCDFLETVFQEYETKEEFDSDGSFTNTDDGKMKGIIMCFMKDTKPHYEYLPLGSSNQEFEAWEAKIMDQNSANTWIRNSYWKLAEVSCVLVEKNDLWINYAYKLIDDVWKIIEKERKEGYEHRAPKKRRTTKVSPVLESTGCLIDVKKLDLDQETAFTE